MCDVCQTAAAVAASGTVAGGFAFGYYFGPILRWWWRVRVSLGYRLREASHAIRFWASGL